MLNNHDRRVFYVGGLVGEQNADFTTLAAAYAAIVAAGGRSAANRALIVVQSATVEAAQINLNTDFIDIHFALGGSCTWTNTATLGLLVGSNIDVVISAESNAAPHLIIVSAAAITASALTLTNTTALAQLQNLNILANASGASSTLSCVRLSGNNGTMLNNCILTNTSIAANVTAASIHISGNVTLMTFNHCVITGDVFCLSYTVGAISPTLVFNHCRLTSTGVSPTGTVVWVTSFGGTNFRMTANFCTLQRISASILNSTVSRNLIDIVNGSSWYRLNNCYVKNALGACGTMDTTAGLIDATNTIVLNSVFEPGAASPAFTSAPSAPVMIAHNNVLIGGTVFITPGTVQAQTLNGSNVLL